MSATAKVTFGTSLIVSAGIVIYVHYKKNADRKKMHDGVIRDVERQHMRRTQNVTLLQKQIELTKKLEKEREGRI